jgi:hypothetical protein
MISGDSARTPTTTTRASGVNPSSRVFASGITTAAAPSLSGQQLAALTFHTAVDGYLSAGLANKKKK